MGDPNMIIGTVKLPLVFDNRKIYTYYRKPTNEEIDSMMPHELTLSLEHKPKPHMSPCCKKQGKKFTKIPLSDCQNRFALFLEHVVRKTLEATT